MVALILMQGIAMAQGQGIFKETSYIKKYGVNEFGRMVFVNDICEDQNGCIALGTTDGICILNSEGHTFYPTPSRSGINHIKFNNGKLLISGDVDHGFYTFDSTGKAVYNDITENTDLKNTYITNLIEGNKKIYLTDKNHIYIYNYQKVEKQNLDNIIASVGCDTIPIIFTKDLRGYCFDGKTINEIINLKDFGIAKGDNIKLVDLCNDTVALICGKKMIACSKGLIRGKGRINASNSQTINLASNDLNDSDIRDAQYDATLNKIAISTNKGIYIFNKKGENIQTVNHGSGLPLEDVRKMFFDSKHNLWASLNSILVKIELNTTTVYYTERQGMSGDIYCFEKFNGQYYCSTFNDVYTATADNSSGSNTIFKKVNFHNSQENIICWNLQVMDNHLLACARDGLYEIKGNDAYKLLSTNKIYSIAKSSLLPGKLIIGGYDGLMTADYAIEGNNLKVSNCKNIRGIDFPIWTIKTSSNGAIWVSTIFNGLYYIVPKDKNIERFSLVNLGENIGIQELRQTKFNITDKYLYVYEKGIRRAEIPENINFIAKDIELHTSELFTRFINQYKATEIYPLNDNGDVLINTNEHCVISYRKDKSFDTIHFQTKVDIVNNVFLRDSLLFLSTNIGLLKHNLNAKPYEKPGEYPFNIFITEISLNDTSVFKGEKYFGNSDVHSYESSPEACDNLGSGIKSLKISYATSCFENSEQIKYSYILEGSDKQWSAYSNENYHEFGQLKPGNYTFRVKALNNYGIVSNEAVYNFEVEQVIYLRWWAILLYMLAFGVIIIIPLNKIIKHLKKENQRLDKLARDRYDEIIRQNERLKLLSLVASKNTNSVMILNGDGSFQWQNDSFTNIYGYTAEEYKNTFGNNYFEIQKAISPDNAHILKNAEDNKERASYETIHIGPNGHRVYAQTHLDPVFEAGKDVKNWIVTETNITQLKLAEKEGMQQAEKLVEAYSDLKRNQDKMEFQTRQLKIINERLEIGYKQIKRQNITINQSLRYANGIQNSILPSSEKFAEFVDHFVIHWPKDIVSGDFYMMEKLSDQSFLTIVADCTGHGVPGAFMSIIGYDLLSQTIRLRKITEPKDILEQLQNQLLEMLDLKRIQSTDGIALSICKFDKNPDNVKLTFAGSDSTIYIHKMADNTLLKLKGSRRQTGINGEVFNKKPFEQEELVIEYADRVIQFSDGIIDQCNDKRIRYGSPRFMNILTKNQQTAISEVGKRIVSDITIFMGDAGQRDDISVLGFNIKK